MHFSRLKQLNGYSLRAWSLFTLVLLALVNPVQAGKADSLKDIHSWRDLTGSSNFKKQDGLSFFQFKTDNGSIANLIVVDLNDQSFTIKPFFSRGKASTTEAAGRMQALAGVNGGYFNLSDGDSASYVVIDQTEQCNPRQNKALVSNPKLATYLPTIFRRSEIRILKGDNGQIKASVALHDEPVAKGWTLKHSLQAGPRLLPELAAREEAFVRTDPDGKEVDSIGCFRPAARTAFGITADNHALIICVAGKGQSEFSSGISLPDLANLLKKLGCAEAINFDGGTSSTMVVNTNLIVPDGCAPPSRSAYKQVCGGSPEKLVRSGLVVLANHRQRPPD